MADTNTAPSSSWLDGILNTGSRLYTTYQQATQPATPAPAPTPVPTTPAPAQTSSSSRWLIIGGIALAAVAVLFLVFKRR